APRAAPLAALLGVDHRPELDAGEQARHPGPLESVEQRLEGRRLIGEEVPADEDLAAALRQRDHVVEDDVEAPAPVAVDAHLVVGLAIAVERDLEPAGTEALHFLCELDIEQD